MSFNNNNNGQQGNGNSNAHYACIATGTIKGRLAADPEVKYEQNEARTKVTARILVNKKNGAIDNWNVVEYKDDKSEYPSSNFRALHEFAKKGRFVTVTGEIRQNSYQDNNGNYKNFMEIKAYKGCIVLDSGSNNNNNGGNIFGQQPQQQGFAAQPQEFSQQPQSIFGQQPQGFGQQPQGNFGGQPQQNNFGQQPQQGGFGQPQGNFGQQPQQNGFGQPQGNFGGIPQNNFGGAPQNGFGQQP